MTEMTINTQRSPAPAVDLPGNPDGKGLSGVMLDWYRTKPRDVVAKPESQLLSELFTSMLVLSASFRYRPVVGAANYLYWINGAFSLSLIAPDEWTSERRAGYVGTCVLQHDMTWTIAPSQALAKDNPVSDAVGRSYRAFAKTLDTDLTLEEVLPSYVRRIPYYQRMLASALSRSLRAAVVMGDQASTSCRQWRTMLPEHRNVLLIQRA